jgi:hypothetical protein
MWIMLTCGKCFTPFPEGAPTPQEPTPVSKPTPHSETKKDTANEPSKAPAMSELDLELLQSEIEKKSEQLEAQLGELASKEALARAQILHLEEEKSKIEITIEQKQTHIRAMTYEETTLSNGIARLRQEKQQAISDIEQTQSRLAALKDQTMSLAGKIEACNGQLLEICNALKAVSISLKYSDTPQSHEPERTSETPSDSKGAVNIGDAQAFPIEVGVRAELVAEPTLPLTTAITNLPEPEAPELPKVKSEQDKSSQ